jgi:ribonuclease Z
MKITLLGTGSPIPDPNRAGPCTLVQAGDRNVLVDCGRGALMRLMAAGVLPAMVDTLLITHLHSDHITDVNDLITTRWVMQLVHTPLNVYGCECWNWTSNFATTTTRTCAPTDPSR